MSDKKRKYNHKERFIIAERDEWICHLCKKSIDDNYDLTIDHVISLKNGGLDEMENLKASHRFCNEFKDKYCPDDVFNLELFKEYKPDLPPIIESTVSLGDLFMNLNLTKQNEKYRQAPA